MHRRLSALLLFGLLTSGTTLESTAGDLPLFPADFAKNLHPLSSSVSVVRNVEEELKQLAVDGEQDSLEAPLATEQHFVVTAIPAASGDDGWSVSADSDEANSPAAPAVTEFALASTGTPQLLVGNINNINNSPLMTTARMSGSDDAEDSNVADEDEEEEEVEVEVEEDHLEEVTSTMAPSEDDVLDVAPSMTSLVYATSSVGRNTYSSDGKSKGETAQKGDELLTSVDDGGKASAVKDVEQTDVEEAATKSYAMRNSTTDDDDDRTKLEVNLDMKSAVMKKAVASSLNARSFMNKDDVRRKSSAAAYEDLMEIVIKVAEHPNDWEEIEQLMEKIEYEDATLKKAKVRLRALAMQKQIKLRKGSESRGNSKPKDKTTLKSENDVLPKAESYQSHFRSHAMKAKPPKFGSVPHQVHITSVAAKQSAHRPIDVDGDYAVEQPVTVIGERSRVDPIEKELLEESTSQRLREIQRQKARLFAIAEKSDDMEGQLKALSKMERRLKEHWRQKQKLIQKIKQENQWKADRTPQPKW